MYISCSFSNLWASFGRGLNLSGPGSVALGVHELIQALSQACVFWYFNLVCFSSLFLSLENDDFMA